MANKYSLKQISAISGRRVFFDANILIYLFWPSGRYNWERDYSSAFNSLLHQGNELFVDFLVISEIINRAHRIEYEKHLRNNNLTIQHFSYKNYRDSVEGQTALSDIYIVVNDSILKNFSIIEKSFNKNVIKSFLQVDQLDFVDKAILNICIENDYVLCTNDRDYKDSNVDILTSNPAIINNL